MLTRAGSVVYATHCNPVQVVPRSLTPGNCSHEIPASFNGTDVFVDPINWVIRPLGTTVHCSDVAPPPFLIQSAWYCQYQGSLMECHEPAHLPIAPLGIDEPTMQLGLRRSIYTDNQMKEFYAFQNAVGARNAFLADQTRSGGDWGLSLGDRAKEMMLDHVGWSFIPLYPLFGPLSILFILIIFVVGLVRLIATLLVRTIIITKKKGCGVWIFAAVWGTLYQLIITPIRWADNTAGRMAKDVELRMNQEAEEPFLYPRLQIAKAKGEAKPIYKRAQELFKKDQSPSAPKGVADLDEV